MKQIQSFNEFRNAYLISIVYHKTSTYYGLISGLSDFEMRGFAERFQRTQSVTLELVSFRHFNKISRIQKQHDGEERMKGYFIHDMEENS